MEKTMARIFTEINAHKKEAVGRLK